MHEVGTARGESIGVLTVLLSLAGASGSAISVMAMGELVRLGASRWLAIAARYGLIGMLTLTYGLTAVDLGAVETTSVALGCVAGALIGIVFINGVLALGIKVLNEMGPATLSVCLLMIPIVTTLLQYLVGLSPELYEPPYPLTRAFLVGAAVILGSSFLALGAERAQNTRTSSPS